MKIFLANIPRDRRDERYSTLPDGRVGRAPDSGSPSPFPVERGTERYTRRPI